MSITDELREWAEAAKVEDIVLTTYPAKHAVHGIYEQLLAIANRIDAEHEAKVSYWQSASYKDGYDEGFASADDWLAQHEDAMAEHGWVKLPVDADGEYIHAGDVLDGYGKTIEVVELRHGRSGWLLISRDGNGYDDTFAFTHHHKPTVEDVLREFAYGLGVPVADSYIAASAAKLRLAGDAE
jgi:hypothetical protein